MIVYVNNMRGQQYVIHVLGWIAYTELFFTCAYDYMLIDNIVGVRGRQQTSHHIDKDIDQGFFHAAFYNIKE